MAGIDLTSLSDGLEIIYDGKYNKMLAYRNNPLLAMIPKSETFEGESWKIRLWHGADQGVGQSMADARTNQSDAQVTAFTVTERKRKYAIHKIDAEAMKASAGAHAFIAGQKMLMDMGPHNLGRELSLGLYRDGSADRGQVAAIVGSVITLTNKQNIVHFEKGMKLRAVDGLGTSPTVRGTTYTVTAVNRSEGKVTLDAVTSIVVGDYLVRSSFQAGASLLDITGVGAWLPATVTSTSFHGVDRTADEGRLGGLRFDGSSMTVEDAVLSAGAYVFQEGSRPDKLFVNPIHEVELAKSLGAKAQYAPVKDPEGIVGFDSFKIRTSAGAVDVIADPNCPPGVGYLLQMNTWCLKTLGPAPHLKKEDGLVLERHATEDAYEVTWRFWGELGCYAPGYNCRITLAT